MTIGPVTELWSFNREVPRVPRPAELQRALGRVDGENVLLEAGPPRKAGLMSAGTVLDLGGIAKGVGVERMAEYLNEKGLDSTLIDAVSSVTALGPKQDGQPWRIGIQSPRPKTTPGLIAVVRLKRGSISTTGDYQHAFTHGGQRYHHVLDPKTGRPAAGFMSVTVVTSKGAAYADALSTGLAVMGRKKSMRLVDKLPGVEVFFIDEDGRFWISDGLKGRLEKIKNRIK